MTYDPKVRQREREELAEKMIRERWPELKGKAREDRKQELIEEMKEHGF